MGTVAQGRVGLRTLISPFKTRLEKGQWQRLHDEMRAAEKDTSCSGHETARSSVKTETSYGEGKSCGLTSGGQNHIASSSWFRLSMMSFPAGPIHTAGTWLMHQRVHLARERRHLSMSSGSVQRHWAKTRYSRSSERQSVVPSTAASVQNPHREP